MKTVIVTPELAHASAPGDMGEFAWHWSRLLRRAGDDVHLMLTRPPLRPSHTWRRVYDVLGITLDVLEEPERFIALPYGYQWHQRMAEVVFEHLPLDADVVYYAERDANGMHHLRRRRFTGERLPVVATVLHGGIAWHSAGMGRWPTRVEELGQDFYERYSAAHSDWAIAPSQAMLRWATDAGWHLPAGERTRVASYPFLPDDELEHDRAGERLPSAESAPFRRLIVYSAPAMRADLALFAEALDALRGKPCLEGVKELVLLGQPGEESVDAGFVLPTLRRALPHSEVVIRLDASSAEVRALLAESAPDALVVMPRVVPGLDYGVIAASLVPGLNLLVADGGSIAELLGPNARKQTFEPFRAPFARTLDRWLLAGSHDLDRLGHYAWREANERWLALHQAIAARARALRQEGMATPADVLDATPNVPTAMSTAAATQPPRAVDVCIPYYNLGAYLPVLLEGLDRQTSQDFNVFLVNDGSPDPQAVAVFDAMARAYAHHAHWRFVTTENQGVCAARNFAASLGSAEFLCFMDADNIPVPTMIERFLQSIHQSGDDCLTCYTYVFTGEGTYQTRSSLTAPLVHYLPIGNCQALGVYTNPFGDINCVMRRSAFAAVGGFTDDVSRYINHEDRELFARLSFAGYQIDVIPEFLCYYRQRAGGRLRTSDDYLNDARVLRVYTEQLAKVGLAELAPLALGMAREKEATASVPGQPVSLHFLVNQVGARLYLKALPHKLRHLLAARLGRPHRPK